MTTRLTDDERDMWKDLYTLHEKYHDRQWTDADWTELTRDVAELYKRREKAPLVLHMGDALIRYFEDVWRASEALRQREGEQLMIGGMEMMR